MKNENKTIFCITCLDSARHSYSRCFGYFFSLEEAKEYLKTDKADIRECLYDYCVVEEFQPGIHAYSLQEVWFKFDEEKNNWVESEAPLLAEGVINFGMG